MALKVNREYGVTIGGEHYPLKTRKKIERIEPKEAKGDPEDKNYEPPVAGNIEEIDKLLEQGYLIDTEAEDEPEPAPKAAKKGKGGK